MKISISFLAAVFVLMFVGISYALRPIPVTDLDKALKDAKAGNKMLFIQYGREACGNCQHLKKLISSGKVTLNSEEFIYADLDCDNPKIGKKFYGMFNVSGSTLPFVVIADSSGKQLASMSGYADENAYMGLIKQAREASSKVRGDQVANVSEAKSSTSQKNQQGVKTIDDIRKSLNYDNSHFGGK